MSEAKLLRENNDRDLVESCSKGRGVAESFTQHETRPRLVRLQDQRAASKCLRRLALSTAPALFHKNSGYAAVTVKLRGSHAVSGILQPRTQPAHRCGEQRNLFGARGQRGLGASYLLKLLTFPVM
ncbi:hypothetical protein HaLaN_05053 [Haematococcus lacustris]|uniref:Uncharacterized protein n=1 Tax=Haematococcus lacustris TaxID=44745 RepID=A0A699YKM3_HAELA|nr:hypothetical protein HaLaN_05053 [Haematococcus lacustris]